MKTMNPLLLKVMRRITERMLTIVQRWEDKHEEHLDYRMDHLNDGLFQASKAMRQILDGEFNAGYSEQELTRMDSWGLTSAAGDRWAAGMLGNEPVPLLPTD